MREAGLPYRCDECQFQTALESYLAGHMRVFHPPEVRRVRAPSRSKIPQILHNPQKLGKSKITKEDTEGSGGEVTEDKSPFVRMISEDLAQADLQDVLKIWEGLGYYARARNLHRAAGIVLNQCHGVMPGDWEGFRKLPGVGDYIAAAVLSIAFEKPYPVVDGNVKRVLARLLLEDAPVNKSTSIKIFKKAADRLLSCQDPGTFNQAMMELGALVCKPRQPLCSACPIQRMCLAHGTGRLNTNSKKHP